VAERFCEDCGRRMPKWEPRRKREGQRVCPSCFATPKGGLVNARDPGTERSAPFPLRASLQTEAHDSSQDQTGVFHCPFCGGGQLVGGGNGSIDCTFCNTTFTVQKQPQFAGVPQTQNGLQMPPPRDQQDRINDYANGQDPSVGPIVPADPNAAQFDPGMSGKPEVIVESYLTPQGVALDRESYLRHLAVAFAGNDREAVLAQVRASRRGQS
jgi:uncharacterized Zn finger protein (UPF0148 family)